ncbi:class I SAM-dependent methyltransferase [Arthrobacter castelli]|uniref:class I SAM-dependent methyltransferase n=1 Tax=Arthrobacter castelli TaxID=271431 RepID=UPI00040916D4|nr:class I SAM-dependent methyltransferase [Arthrobacter castelli]
MNNKDVRRGANIYSKPVLGFYDLLVVRLSNTLAWRCPSRLMLDQYNRFLGQEHLDVGPGTGWYLIHAHLPERNRITLMDLNENSMEHTGFRLAGMPTAGTRPAPRAVTGNVLEPIPEHLGNFDSIATNYLFHCIPGTWETKSEAFGHLADRLTDDGVLFGGTILGHGVRHNTVGKGLMALYNRMGIFHNRDDAEAGLQQALERSFHQTSVKVVGTVAVFNARQPRR